MSAEEFRLVVFDQTNVEGASLGPWCLMEVSVFQLIVALGYPVGARHQPSARMFTVDGRPLRLPLFHDLHWNSTLESERELSEGEASAHLTGGAAIQVFIFNGDSDCVRHHLILPLGEPVFWLPDR